MIIIDILLLQIIKLHCNLQYNKYKTMSKQTLLLKEQKQAIGLLSAGTFLEYFDLMLYVHMSVLLNDLFFSKTDSFSESLLSAFSFCATFIFRPIGAILLGTMGDKWGRKSTVILTTLMMATACVTIANLPTYEQIGVTASIVLTICRIAQGMSCTGEKIGAEIYLTEIIKSPLVYSAVAFILLCGGLGASFALLIADFAMSKMFDWRAAFWIGAIIAVVGTIARSTLRETTDFANAKKVFNTISDNLEINKNMLKQSTLYTEKLNIKAAISYFLVQLGTPVYFYFSYIYCAGILKESFGYTSGEVIYHNFLLSIVELAMFAVVTYLVSFIHPIRIVKTKFWITAPFLLICPYLLNHVTSNFQLSLIQLFIIVFSPTEFPCTPIFYKSFPIFKRFTASCFIHTLSRACMYVISAFGMIYLIKYFGNLGLLFLFIPINIGFILGLLYFERLEKRNMLTYKKSSYSGNN
jgi:MHS family proline/betaine transporter-like MFS transporter